MSKYFEGIGRRKTSTSRVRIFEGDKVSTINELPIEEYFKGLTGIESVLKEPLVLSNLIGKYYFTAKVMGGGTTGQVEAIRLGLANAIVNMDESLKSELRKNDLVTRDPRAVERKKYNRRKARKKPQFSKR